MKKTSFTLMVGLVGLSPMAAVSSEGDKTPAAISPCVALTGADSHVSERGYFRITTLKDWTRIWQEHKGLKQNEEYDVYSDPAGLPLVDFERFMVIAVFQGRSWNSAGLRAVSIVEEQERIVFRFDDKSYQTAGPDGGGKQVSAYGFFVIARSTKAVVLEENVQGLIGKAPVWKERITFPKL